MPDPKKEYMEKISGTGGVYVDGINVGIKKKKNPQRSDRKNGKL